MTGAALDIEPLKLDMVGNTRCDSAWGFSARRGAEGEGGMLRALPSSAKTTVSSVERKLGGSVESSWIAQYLFYSGLIAAEGAGRSALRPLTL